MSGWSWPSVPSNDHFCGPGTEGRDTGGRGTEGRTGGPPRSGGPDEGRKRRWRELEAQRTELERWVEPDTPRSMAPHEPSRRTAPPLDDVPYVELHLHSHYSLLEGASSIDELLELAREQGHRALALTDHNGLFGAMEFAHAATEAGLRPITGLELTVVERTPAGEVRSHLTLLAETRRGYANLCRLSSIAYGLREEQDRGRQERRLDPCVAFEELERHAAGLIVLTGCREGRIAQLLQAGRGAEAERRLRRLVDWFGRDDVFVELQDNDVLGDGPRNRALVELAARVGVGVVGTGNVHYHEQDRHRLQDVMTAIRHRSTLEECHRERRPNAEFYLRSPAQQAARFAAYHPQAAASSVRIARRCSFDLTEDLGYRLPSPRLASGRTPQQELEAVCRERLRERYASAPPSQRAAAESRLTEELALIERHGLGGFFLIYHQIFELATEVAEEVRGAGTARARANMPPGRGRGSSVSSIVCYLVGLSHIDPIQSRLTIGRFLNEEMRTLPDIDLDFARDTRARLIERVYEVWGKEHAALVAIFPTYRLRSALRDVGKALGLPASEIEGLAKRANPHEGVEQLPGELARHPEFADRLEAQGWRDLADLAQQLAGFPRHLSQHVGGMVISSEPLIDHVPCQPAAWPNRYLCHWDKDSIDDARMVKIDFLGLGMLSVVEETIERISEHEGQSIDLSRIPYDDEAVFGDIRRGDTVGVFQIESRAQIAMLPRTQPRTLDDLTIQVSIVRPGPIVGGAVNPYVRERERQRALGSRYRPPSVHPCVDEVLEETLGVVLFQEQVVEVARRMGGFSAGQAEQFRRAMSRKRSLSVMQRYEQDFMDGARARDVPPAVAERMFQNLLGFAEFGFPKSHGAAFGLLAYQTTWLKRHHPAPFFCALFNNQPMGFYPPHVLTNDARRHEIEVWRPHINVSDAACVVEEPGAGRGAVRIGLGYVRGVGAVGGARVTAERERGGAFLSLFDFVQRTGLGRAPTQSLIRVGAFDEFGLNRRELIWQLGLLGGGMQRLATHAARERQLRLALPTEQDQVALPGLHPYERMATDYELLSLSPDSHPMQFLRPALGEGVASSQHLRAMPGGTEVEIAGLVVCRQRPMTAKGIVFLLLEDEFGLVNVLVSRTLVERFAYHIRTEPFVRVRGVLDARNGEQRTLVAAQIGAVVPAEVFRTPSGKSWG